MARGFLTVQPGNSRGKEYSSSEVCCTEWIDLQENESPPCVQINFTTDLRFKGEGLEQSHVYMLQALGLIPETKKKNLKYRSGSSTPWREHKTISS